jgi:hypothetical protein
MILILILILIITLFFEKNANCFAENCQKSQKIVIITSTPGPNPTKHYFSNFTHICKIAVCGTKVLLCNVTDHLLNTGKSGLPDGFFSNQKSQFVLILEGLAMEDVGIFYVHSVNFPAIWHILWPLGIFYPVLVHFYPCWYVVSRKIWQPWDKYVNGLL